MSSVGGHEFGSGSIQTKLKDTEHASVFQKKIERQNISGQPEKTIVEIYDTRLKD